MSGQSPFQPRVLLALGAALVALFAASLLLTGAGGNRSAGNPIGPNTYSRSAVGHLGLFDVLQKLGYRAVRNEQNTLPMLGTDGVLVLAEPAGGFFGAEDKRKLLGAPAVLLVLPKWSVDRSEEHDGWIGAATLAPQSLAQLALNAIAGPGKVVQVAKPSAFVKSLVVPDPTVEAPIQLIANSKMRPLVATSDGILLGEFREGLRRVWVLADPDPIENHGIGKGNNFAFVNGIIDGMLAGKGGALVFDETIHGFQHAAPNPLTFLFQFPFNLVAAQVVVGVTLLLMAAMGRFGAPEIPERVLNSGKQDLISNAASLIDHAGHHAAIFRRYTSIVLQDTAQLLRAPRQTSEADLAAWLDKAAESRGTPQGWRAAVTRVAVSNLKDPAALLAQARTIHRWKKDVIDGISGRLSHY